MFCNKLARATLAYLLIATLLASQSLCASHSHANIGLIEEEGNTDRPHIHVGFMHEHAHHSRLEHGNCLSSSSRDAEIVNNKAAGYVSCGFDHDADAFYLGQGVSIAIRGSAACSGAADDSPSIIDGWSLPSVVVSVSNTLTWTRPPPLSERTGCGLYLLYLSIRC